MTDLSKLVWVFAHGSLMFDPGFDPADTIPGRAWGWERRFGQPSVRNWGTSEAPAPTSSLSRGEACDGLLLGLPQGRRGSVLRSLVRREAADPITLTVTTEHGDVAAFSWLMSDSWASLSVEDLAARAAANILAGGGPRGDAWRYVTGVNRALEAHGLSDVLVSRYVGTLGLQVDDSPPGPPPTTGAPPPPA